MYLTEEEKTININCEHLEPVLPEKGDKVSWLYEQVKCWLVLAEDSQVYRPTAKSV